MILSQTRNHKTNTALFAHPQNKGQGVGVQSQLQAKTTPTGVYPQAAESGQGVQSQLQAKTTPTGVYPQAAESGQGAQSQLQAKTTPSGVYPQAAESGYDTATNWHQHLVSYIQACSYVAYCMSVHGVHATGL